MTSKGTQDVRRLVQLGSNVVGPSSVRFLIRYQLVLIALVFVVTFALSRSKNYLTTFIPIPEEAAIEFFSATSQALAALLGLLIVFLTFRIQTINQQRNNAYRELQVQISKLIHLSLDRPDELKAFDNDLVQIIDSFTFMRMKHFPIWASQYNASSNIVLDFISKSCGLKERLPRSARLHLQHILLVLDNIAEIVETFSELYIGIQLMSRTVVAITKLSFLLGTSLVLLLVLGIVDLQKTFPGIGLSIVITLMTWLLVVLLELAVDTWRLYRDLRQPWNHPVSR